MAEQDDETRIDIRRRKVTGSTASLLEKGSQARVEEGDLLDERFLLEREIGRGGMSVVFRARDLIKEHAKDPDPFIAVKVLTGGFAEQPDAWIALQREINKSQALAHPRIVTVHDFKIDRELGVPFAQMEELRGESLQAFLDRHPTGVPDGNQLESFILGIAEGLEYAHERGIVHADLKPSNVFITRESGIKLLDFGISRFISRSKTDFFDSHDLGALTPTYASPEVFAGGIPTPQDDLFALGILAHELATGRHPFADFLEEEQPSVAARDAGFEVKRPNRLGIFQWRAIRQCLSFEAAERPENGADFLLRFRRRDRTARYLGALAASLAVVTVFALVAPRDPGPQLDVEDLPQAQQLALSEALVNGDQALALQDYNGALVYYAQAYDIHPRNPDAVEGLDKIVDAVVEQPSPDNQQDLAQALTQIETLLSYPALAESRRLRQLRTKLLNTGADVAAAEVP